MKGYTLTTQSCHGNYYTFDSLREKVFSGFWSGILVKMFSAIPGGGGREGGGSEGGEREGRGREGGREEGTRGMKGRVKNGYRVLGAERDQGDREVREGGDEGEGGRELKGGEKTKTISEVAGAERSPQVISLYITSTTNPIHILMH